jgi:hypothetical protein
MIRKIRTQRTTGAQRTGQRIAITITDRRQSQAVYTLTDSSLVRIERLAVQKTTRRFTSLCGVPIIENDYTF